ncbi:MAG: polysaccharide pyruvyl transferase family protein [Bacilli bacterium]|nr:polysaccharide pyruvyl transferase family protein [Bacilli bacterium]
MTKIKKPIQAVGIVTSIDSFENNYGAILQCYALCEQIKKWGFTPVVINYESLHNASNKKKNGIVRYIFSNETNLFTKIKYRLKKKKRAEMASLFRYFKDKHFKFEPTHKLNFEDLCKYDFGFNIFIAGSDQIWNPLNHANQNDPCCFLQFTKKEDKRISYAASFGITNYPNNCMQSLNKYLSTFQTISVRERSGFDIISKCNPLIKKNVVLDPTLMADKDVYDNLHSENVYLNLPKRFILVYRFGSLPFFQEQLMKIKKTLKLPIIELPCSINAYNKKTKLIFNCGPGDFSYIISKAALVITDSFHCTVFSIINKTPFLTFLRQGKDDEHSMDCRMIEFLTDINLQSRLVFPNSEIKFDKESIFKVDFASAHKILNDKRLVSQKLLKDSLIK